MGHNAPKTEIGTHMCDRAKAIGSALASEVKLSVGWHANMHKYKSNRTCTKRHHCTKVEQWTTDPGSQ